MTDKLRDSVEPAEYKHGVPSLFFIKFTSDKFETQRKMIAEKYRYGRGIFDAYVGKGNILTAKSAVNTQFTTLLI